jgi:precorrin-8X/cobalt-precorrin-8 methylmutase
MLEQGLTIKELTDAVGGGITPRMVRHYHTLGLMPPAPRSQGNYRLYSAQDVQRLRQIVALKQQGFQLTHIQHLLEHRADQTLGETVVMQLQQQYQTVVQQLIKLRQTATALETVLGRDHYCQQIQAEALAQLKQLEVESLDEDSSFAKLWQMLDQQVGVHPEAFSESLQGLLPDLDQRNEIEAHLLSQLVLACGDVSLVPFVRLSRDAIAAARKALKAGSPVLTDVPMVSAALDQTRLAHLNCISDTLIADPHVSSVTEAEQTFWQQQQWREKLQQVKAGTILVIGYAPSVLVATCTLIEQEAIQPALVVGMPIGFSHAPAAKRRLMQTSVPAITVEGSSGGGILAAVALNALAESLLEKPNCHCYLSS